MQYPLSITIFSVQSIVIKTITSIISTKEDQYFIKANSYYSYYSGFLKLYSVKRVECFN